ncbi:MAG: neutral zinc metallopeptidase [Desulfovibrio sp.]|nr:neutral zinc metallopeptidase [Desulfovibrio sp.]
MRWQDREGSSNVEDRRGSGGGGAFGRGGGYGVRGGIPLRGKTGLIVIAIVIVAALYGYDLTPLLEGSGLPVQVQEQQRTDSGQARGSRSGQSGTGSPQDEMGRFISVMLKTTEEAWGGIFGEAGKQYSPARLVLYTGQTSTACGYGQSAMGPFYCPADEKVYLDLSFYRDMQNHLGGGGDFALGYVLAHEVGHHVQNQLGITDRVSGLERGASKKEANRLSVMLELQADCFAGVWGRYTADQGMLENGDLQEALDTAAAIGDDRLQRQSQGRVVPDSFTHGTSKQRYTWFRRGFDSGNPQQCNTFAEMR